LINQVYLVDDENNNHRKLLTLPNDDAYISSFSFDRSGEACALGTSDSKILIYDVERG
jgi:WD40 repeat protein